MSTWLVDHASALLSRRSSRRGFLVSTAVVGSALAVAPRRYVLEPQSAYAAVCGPDTTFAAGYTAFCCTVNRGLNACPPGTFAGGWWKADGSSYCCDARGASAPRYYIDCQGECTACSGGCGGAGSFCSAGCHDCSCHAATGSCDTRRACCNYFRYGQCHQEVACSGPVACRVISCTPPYALFAECGSTSATDDNTAQHTAPCLIGACR